MHLSRGERVFEFINYGLLAILTLVFILPILFVVSNSLVSEAEVVRRGTFVLIPQQPDLTAYRTIFSSSIIGVAYLNTLLRVIVGVTLNLAFTASLAYALAKRTLPGRGCMTVFIFVPLIFSGGIIPLYILVNALGLRNSFWSMILPVLVNPFWLLIMRNFFMTIPQELEEAAIMDGASPFTVLTRIVIPLSMPIFTTIGLFYAVFHWNAWFDAAIFIDSPTGQPVQLLLRNVLLSGVLNDPAMADYRPPAEALKAALTIVSAVPILLVYPFIQKYFVKGVLIGGIKG
ncbi:MAG: carbohydrate ABC transporter permease [Anaerolineae bacterium]